MGWHHLTKNSTRFRRDKSFWDHDFNPFWSSVFMPPLTWAASFWHFILYCFSDLKQFLSTFHSMPFFPQLILLNYCSWSGRFWSCFSIIPMAFTKPVGNKSKAWKFGKLSNLFLSPPWLSLFWPFSWRSRIFLAALWYSTLSWSRFFVPFGGC